MEFVTFIIVCAVFQTQTLSACNLVKNPSFENDGQWDLMVRSSMWTVKPSVGAGIRFSADRAHSGSRALVLDPNTGAAWSYHASQYLSKNALNSAAKVEYLGVLFSFWTIGKQDAQIKVLLDISYSDERHLSSEINPSKPSDMFAETCVYIPAYGAIRAMMINLIIEGNHADPVWVDDVSLTMTSYPDNHCEVHTRSFPTARQVLPNFLVPQQPQPREAITLATQITLDRLRYFKVTASVWTGPISVAIMLYRGIHGYKEQVNQVVENYFKNSDLYKNVRIHLVMEDIFENDRDRYPVNFLRNVALKHACSSHVFLLDGDILPSFDEKTAMAWLQSASNFVENGACVKCAFIAPLFHATTHDAPFPRDKKTLLEIVRGTSPVLEPFMGASHAVVRYHEWYVTSDPYVVNYYEDMEPYFIVRSDSPLMNDMFSGYGRDKCAYSRQLHNSGYKFLVMPEAFLINRPDPPGAKNIYDRSNGLHLKVFLNAAFHRYDMENGYTRYPLHPRECAKPQANERTSKGIKQNAQDEATSSENMKQTKTINEATQTEENPISKRTKANALPPQESPEPKESHEEQKQKEHLDNGSVGCKTIILDNLSSLSGSLPLVSSPHILTRKDVLLEHIIRTYGTGVYIEVPTPVTGSTNLMLPLVHPDAIVSVQPSLGQDITRDIKGLFETYTGSNNVTELLKRAKADHPGPCVMWINNADQTVQSASYFLTSVLLVVSESDIILLEGLYPRLKELQEAMCSHLKDWRIYYTGSVYLLKSKHTHVNKVSMPPTPAFVHNLEQPLCIGDQIKTDIILMTKNRPLQTHAFLQSLYMLANGVHKVFILYRADDELFEQGYQFLKHCFSERLDIMLIKQTPGQFGRDLLNILKTSAGSHVVISVDEMIWVRPVDLKYASCLLNQAPGEVAGFQLRLGVNLGIYKDLPEKQDRFLPLRHNKDIYLYYPRRLLYDFGYVLHVDGLLMKTRDVIADIEALIPNIHQPSSLENMWGRTHLHMRSQQWHLMFKKSVVTNNVLSDGRVIHREKPAEDSYHLARLLLHQRKAVDVKTFAKHNADPPATHLSQEVSYIDLIC